MFHYKQTKKSMFNQPNTIAKMKNIKLISFYLNNSSKNKLFD